MLIWFPNHIVFLVVFNDMLVYVYAFPEHLAISISYIGNCSYEFNTKLEMCNRVESGSDDPDNLGYLGHFFRSHSHSY